jgi:phospholipase C
MRRREVLKSVGAAAGAATVSRLLSACGDGGGEAGITTLVLLMMENRSYDHLLGARSWLEDKPGDGLTAAMRNPDLDGNEIAPWEATADTMCPADPAHGWQASHIQFNDGALDGFVTTHQAEHGRGDDTPMQYLTRRHQPVTWALADAYATCDRWFASVMGPTWPNRFYWVSGTSMGMTGNDIPSGGYTAPTIYHRLDEAGIDWRIYYADLPFVGLLGAGAGLPLRDHTFRLQDFFRDAARGQLPPVVYLDPPFTLADDHPPHHPIRGQEYLASVYNALAASPQWRNCLLVVTYDEHGGFFDHVPPPTAPDDHAELGFDQLGFRVPTIVVGPYVKQGYVSSVVRDHTSALRHLEVTLGTAPLTARSSAAADLTELLDLDRLARGAPAAPIELPPVDVDAWTYDAMCNASTLKPGHVDLVAYADAHPRWRAQWDRRAELPAVERAIAEHARRRREP